MTESNIRKSPRVMHLVPALFSMDGVMGGAERYALELARHMNERVPTTLVTFGASAKIERIGGLRVKTLPRFWNVGGIKTNPVSPALWWELRRADVIHCHQSHILTSSLAALSGRVMRKKVYVTDHGGGGWDISSYVSTDRWYRGFLHQSNYARKITGHEDKLWAHIIMGGVSVNKFAPSADSSARDAIVRYIGRILPHKGIDDLVRAVPPELPLEIIGQPYDPAFLEHLRDLAIGKKVTFRFDCDDDALIEAYRNALCVVLPSVYNSSWNKSKTLVPELLGQTLLEAMSCGTPVICTDVASMPEIVVDGETGFVVPPNDPNALQAKLCYMRDHPEEVAQLGAEARQHVLRNFTWSSVVDRCLNIYLS